MNVMLHLGLGSFHRAHQAVYLHQLISTGNASWALAGGNIRPDMADTIASLAAQGGAYTLDAPRDRADASKCSPAQEAQRFSRCSGNPAVLFH